MPTLLDYFEKDFKGFCLDFGLTISISKPVNEKIEVKCKVLHGYKESTKLMAFYIPETIYTNYCVNSIIEDVDISKSRANDIELRGSYPGDKEFGTHSHIFSNRIYIYTEMPINEVDEAHFDTIAKNKGLFVTVRSKQYCENIMKDRLPLAFISHDSRDKDQIVRHIVYGLESRICHVWYDEFSLKIGDSLRTSIEKGIKEAKKCVLVLTPNFLSNPGWTKKEFDSIFTRELLFDEKIILPIWYGVTKYDIYQYSPSLADAVALVWPKVQSPEPLEDPNIQKIISKLHTAITS